MSESEPLDDMIDEKFKKLSPRELMNSPVYAMKGINETDAFYLRAAFKINSIKELAENKYVKIAQKIVAAASIE